MVFTTLLQDESHLTLEDTKETAPQTNKLQTRFYSEHKSTHTHTKVETASSSRDKRTKDSVKTGRQLDANITTHSRWTGSRTLLRHTTLQILRFHTLATRPHQEVTHTTTLKYRSPVRNQRKIAFTLRRHPFHCLHVCPSCFASEEHSSFLLHSTDTPLPTN